MGIAVTIIGLGNAGAALAQPLSRNFRLTGFDIDPGRKSAVKHLEIAWADSVESAVADAAVVLLSLPRPEISLQVVNTIANAGTQARVVIETSTVSPKTAVKLAAICAQSKIGFVDAAIAGGVQSMAAGKNTFLIGGSDADFAKARDVLEPLAERIHHLGPVGTGSGAKVINNAVMHALMVVLIEAGAMARKIGLPMATVIEILARPDGIMRPLEHRLRDRIGKAEYAGGMSVTNARKDSMLALETAQDLGVPLFATLAAHTPYEIAEQLGYGELDYASLAKLWEAWCDLQFS